MFTMQNTDGFTNDQLNTLNAALEIRTGRGEDTDAASDAINNAWVEGASVSDLV